MLKRPMKYIFSYVALLLLATPSSAAFELWDPSITFPMTAEIPLLSGVDFQIIKAREPEVDGYDWLHGASIIKHEDVWYTTWGNNAGDENTPTEVVRGRRSYDDFATLTEVEMITPGTATEAVSHGTLLSHQGQLWGFFGRFEGVRENVRTEAYVLNEQTDQWESQGIAIGDGFWPMDEPIMMDNGNFIMGGLKVGDANPPAVAISHGNDVSQWDMVTLPLGDGVSIWGESTVIVDGANILNIARGSDPWAYASVSDDYGQTWSPVVRTNMPMAASKPFAGTLSDGRNYLICTNTADSGNTRNPLTISLTGPGGTVFNEVYRIRDGIRPGEDTTIKAALAYPYAVEEDGNLYIVYSVGRDGGNRNSCEMAVVPISSLQGYEPNVVPSSSVGRLIAYDGFNYPATSTIDQYPTGARVSGTGWGGTWQNPDQTLGVPADESSLVFPQGVAFTSVGARTFNRSGESHASRVFDDFTVSFDEDGVYYLSYLAKKTDTSSPSNEWLQVLLMEQGTSTILMGSGYGSGENLLLGSDLIAGQFNVGEKIPSGETTYFAIKVGTRQNGDDAFYLKAYGEGEVVGDEPTTWDLVYLSDLSSVSDRIEISVGQYADGEIDEVRFGTGWASVVTGLMPIPGDANNDGRVDGSDVTILAGNWQAGVDDSKIAVTWEMGDFNGDGRVDGSDVTILAGNWQAGVDVAATSVPEPSVVSLIFGLVISICVYRSKG